jgi:hypothetical protein
MRVSTPNITAPDCTCGKKPAIAYGSKDDYWTVVIMCREPENHEPLNELYCIVTRSLKLNEAITEAEKMWLDLLAARTSRPTSRQLD